MKRIQSIVTGMVALMGAALGTMMAQAQNNNGDMSLTRRPLGFLEAQITTDRTQYNSNRAVQISLTLTNLGSSRWIGSPGGKREYDVNIRDSRTNKIVYALSRHKQLPSHSYSLDAGETRTYSELWDKRDDGGERLRSGVYVIEATVWPQQMVSAQIYLGEGGRPGGGDGTDNPRPNPNPGTSDDYQNLRGTIRIEPRRPAPGQTATISYTVRNVTRDTVSLRFNSGKQHEITVRDSANRPVWVSTQGTFYTQSLTSVILRPGQEKTFESSWRVPQNLPYGRYEITGRLAVSRSDSGDAQTTSNITIDRNGGVAGNGDDNGNYGGGSNNGGGRDDYGNNGDNGYGGSYGSSGGITFGDGFTLGSGGVNAPHFMSLRELASPRAANYIGQRVTVSAMYNGTQGGNGLPPVNRNDWVIASEGVTMYVNGATPSAPIGRKLSVVGVVRRARDGRVYLQAN